MTTNPYHRLTDSVNRANERESVISLIADIIGIVAIAVTIVAALALTGIADGSDDSLTRGFKAAVAIIAGTAR